MMEEPEAVIIHNKVLMMTFFQIPITVLQSVAKLITNPFTTAKKNTEVTDS